MTQAAPHQPNPAVRGSALLAELRASVGPLPTRTLFAMALGGLRVRLMRSGVTMLSILLAIAFLTYTGLNGQLTQRLARHIVALEDLTPLDSQRVADAVEHLLTLEPWASLDLPQRVAWAKLLQLDDTRALELKLPELETAQVSTALSLQKATEQQAKITADATATPGERQDAAANVRRQQTAANHAQQVLDQASSRIVLSNWLRRDGKPEPAVLATLDTELAARVRDLLGRLTRPARLDQDQLAQVTTLLESYHPLISADQRQLLDDVLLQEQRKRQAAELKNLLRRSGVNYEQTLQGSPLDTWLVIMALLTCAVGIANAMLMSVTERFREIGTMKCLGAQDGLVVKLFLLESSVLGAVGAVLGIALGLLVATLGAALLYRGYGLSNLPLLGGLKIVALSLVAGLLLAVVGAVYPAFAASRMRPVDALRVDE